MKKDLKVQNKNLYQKMGVSFLFLFGLKSHKDPCSNFLVTFEQRCQTDSRDSRGWFTRLNLKMMVSNDLQGVNSINP